MLSASKASPPPMKAILVWDRSRFSRDHLEAQFYTANLRLRGYQIVSILDDISSGEMRMIFEALIMWKNAKYLRDLQAATIWGLDALEIGEGALAVRTRLADREREKLALEEERGKVARALEAAAPCT